MANAILRRVIAAKGNSLAADEIIRDYLPFIRSEVAKLKPDSADGDELSIAMIGFHEAINSYQSDRGAFLSYAAVVMKNRLIDYYRSESRHRAVPLTTPVGEDLTLEDTLMDSSDFSSEFVAQTATAAEIYELSNQLQSFGLTLSDIAEQNPKQERTLNSIHAVIQYVQDHPDIIKELLQTKKLPIKQVVDGTGVHKKTLERHRKYLMALMIIYSNGYEIIRNHIGLTFIKEGGARQ